MLSNEQRAHDLAVAITATNFANDSTQSNYFEAAKSYLSAYKTILSSLIEEEARS